MLFASFADAQFSFSEWDSLYSNDKLECKACEFNSTYNDYSPVVLNNGHILFSSDRINPKTREAALANNENIYEYNPKSGKSKYSYFYNSDDHTAIGGNSANGKIILIYKAIYNGNIYFSNGNSQKDKLRKFISPGLAVNNDDYCEQSAAIWTNYIVFSSARKEDPNDFDLYFAMLDENYKVDKVNPIAELNTENPEVDVRFTADGILTFSVKNGAYYKPYYSKFDGVSWSTPEEIPFIPDEYAESSIRDFVLYDSSFYFSANNVESEQFDIFVSTIKKDSIFPEPDTLAEILPDTLTPFDQKLQDLQETLDSMEFKPYRAFVQVGAYQFVRTIDEFKSRFPAFSSTALVVEEETEVAPGENTIIRYMIDKTYYTLKEAAIRQQEALQQQADPANLYESLVDAFIAVYDSRDVRIVIFFNLEKKEFKILVGDEVVYF
ncbi:MAG: hypothetical protein C0592_01340 [Marinilabiliales bacterium]|nr:MAG: hypothetical protein C0592_01340 [Marinilabiliales bacterium]